MPLHELRLHQLEGFYQVGQAQGFTRAAQALPYPITESALHQQVRRLEATLGVSLLVRGGGRRMLMTSEGRALHAFVAPFYERLGGLLRGLRAGSAGALVVAAEALYIEPLCVPAAARLRREAGSQDLRISILERETGAMADGLRRGELDLGLAAVSDPPEGCDFTELGRLGLSLLVGPRHPLARRRAPPRLAQLDGLALVHYEAGSPARIYAERALAAAGLRHTAAAQVSGSTAMRALVGAGLGAAFVPAVGKHRPRRSRSRDGVVAFDVTNLLREVSPLPRYGWLTRRGQALAGLAARFAAIIAAL